VPAVPFADVLDRLIDAGPGPSTTAATASIFTPPLLGPSHVYRFPKTARPRRRLSSAQRAALDTFRLAGASLVDDYLLSELKSAFRTLARQLHPDMHPEAGDFKRHRLATEFASIRDAYDALLKEG